MDEVNVESVPLVSVASDSVNVEASLSDSEPPTSLYCPESAPVVHSRHLSEDLSALTINDLRVNNGEHNFNEQIEGKGISSHGHIRHFSADLSSLASNDVYANKGEENGHNLLERKVESRPNSAERKIYKAAEIAERFIQSIDNRVLVDTGAPIESVKEAVSKFGGILDWKERRKNVQNELDKALEDTPDYQRRAEVAEVEKNQVLMELNRTRRTIEGLKLNLESAETEAIQAQQDSELVNIRFREIQQGIACRESAATKAEIDLAKYRHANALAELQSVKDEIEQLQKEHTSLKTKRDNAETKACESSAASQEIEKTVDDLTLELIAQMVSARVKLAKSRKELEDMRADIKKAKDEVRILWNAAATLRADIERQEADLGALRHKEHLSSVSVSSIQEELSNKAYELNIVHERTKAAEMPAELQQATKVMEQANSKAQMARHEKAKAKEEADQAKAQVNVVKLRLEAVSREILAVNTSEKIATASANALQEYKQETPIDPQADRVSDNYVTISLEEYDALSKKAQDAECLAKKRVIKAVEKIKQAKDAEVRGLNQLEQLAKKMNERKLELRAAQEKANSAQYGKLTMENELRKRRAKHEQQRDAGESAHSISDIADLKSTSWSFDASAAASSNPQMVGSLSRAETIAATRVKEPKPRKSLFPRSIVAMFVSRTKKTH
nr:unnamed protein product [Digitaria exilis]